MKVKIFSNRFDSQLERSINDFIAEIGETRIVSINYSAAPTRLSTQGSITIEYTAMVTYKDGR